MAVTSRTSPTRIPQSRPRRWFPLEFGSFGPLLVRREPIHLGLSRPVRLLYASDLHLGHWWSGRVPDQLCTAAGQAEPDLILLGGDLADHQGALPQVHDCVKALASIAPVFAIPGNHDVRAGVAAVRGAVVKARGHWLRDCSLEFPVRIDALLSAARGTEPRVLCAHYPGDFPAAARAGYRLVLAGHLHGGQCVLAMRHGNLYPAAWFYRWHGLRFVDRAATMLVSRGVADTFPLRFNCPREVILCELT